MTERKNRINRMMLLWYNNKKAAFGSTVSRKEKGRSVCMIHNIQDILDIIVKIMSCAKIAYELMIKIMHHRKNHTGE